MLSCTESDFVSMFTSSRDTMHVENEAAQVT